MTVTHRLRQCRAWLRNPLFYMKKAKVRYLGQDLSFLEADRSSFELGSREWLALSEVLYGGFQKADKQGPHKGGDRMSPTAHNYGPAYAKFLQPFLHSEKSITLVEVGILNGTGIAIWCDMFPKARVIGLDFDLENFQSFAPRLKEMGAFRENTPIVHRFDQLDAPAGERILSQVLGDTKVDVVIDDGCHTLEAAHNTWTLFSPYLADRFVYFIEDNFDSYEFFAKRYRAYRWRAHGELTVCCPKS